MRFSERFGLVDSDLHLQLKEMDEGLRNRLWNVSYEKVWKALRHGSIASYEMEIAGVVWRQSLNLSADRFDSLVPSEIVSEAKKRFFGLEWYRVYEVIEDVAKLIATATFEWPDDAVNRELERGRSAYRMRGGELIPLADDTETSEIEEAQSVSADRGLSGVRAHLDTALEKLSARPKADYRNSIKESISAVESLAKVLTGDENASLGDALKEIEKHVELHPALKAGYSKIYGYTSNEKGLRHAYGLTDEDKADFATAKYMLVSCAAFVNYLVLKAEEAGIEWQEVEK